MAAPEPVDEFSVPDKEDGYRYKWCNGRERVMLQRHRQGYEVVTTPEKIPEELKAVLPPSEGSAVRRRGDLVLMRIREDLWQKNVNGPIRAARERTSVALDTMVQQANEQAQRAMRSRGYSSSQLRADMVFSDGRAEPLTK